MRAWRRSWLPLALLLSAVFLLSPATVMAQDSGDPAPVEISHGGWGATAGFWAYMTFASSSYNLARAALAPDDPSLCELKPEACEPSGLDYLLATTVGVGFLTVVTGAGFGGWGIARWLEFNPRLGWGLAGGSLGSAVGAAAAVFIPTFEPQLVSGLLQLTTVVGFGVASGLGTAAVAERRGHAWPEFGFGAGGYFLGLLSGYYICDKKFCPWLPTFALLGTALGVAGAGLAFGYSPRDADEVAAREQELMMTLFQYGGQF